MQSVARKYLIDNFRFDGRNRHVLALFSGLALCVTLSANGCNKPGGAVSVRGRLAYQDQPLHAASVTFFPTSGRPVTATAPQGDYATELKPGEYTVVVAVGTELPAGFKEGDPMPAPKVVLPEAYTNRANSTLKATVKEGQNEPINFDLK
jgi:hypothetical protein